MYSVVSIRNMFKLSHLAVIEAIQSGFITVTGDGENLETYYTDKKGLSYLKQLAPKGNVGHMVVIQ